MGVGSGRSKAANLTISVFGRSISPDWFAVRGHRRITRTGWEADVRIVEGGHAIVWASGGARISEVLAAPEIPLPEPGRLYQATAKRERAVKLAPGPRVEYQTCVEAERLDAEVFAHLCEELTLDATSGDLVHRFRPANRMAPAAISRIHVEPRGRGLSIHAFHTFPEERAIVRVQSLFEVA
jgi:Protein of unknown function DUF2617